MSETDKPQPTPDQPAQPAQGQAAPEEQSGAEAPAQPAQPAPEPPPQQQTVQAPPAQPVPRRPARTFTMRTWVAAGIGALILVAAGLGGFFIGAATDNDHHDRPGAGRFDHRPAPNGPRDFPRFRDGGPNRGGTPG